MNRPTHPHEFYYPEDESLCRLLKVYADSFGSYLWQAGTGVGVYDFGGSEDLDARFSAWAEEYPDGTGARKRLKVSDARWQDWKERGRLLCKEFREVLPDEYALFYYPFPEPCEDVIEITKEPKPGSG